MARWRPVTKTVLEGACQGTQPDHPALVWGDVIEGGPLSPRNGRLPVPTGPGLGIVLDPRAAKRCHERYLAEGRFPAGSASEHYGESFRKT